MEYAQLIAQIVIAALMLLLTYGAYLIIRDSDLLFKAKYGNVLFVSKADKEKHDAEWDSLTREQQLERIQNVSKPAKRP
jgi:uncharacterized protein YfeS